MLKLSKKVEYAILATQYLSNHPGDKLTAKEIAKKLKLPFGFLSKTMQALMKAELVDSIQGVNGGYILTRPADSITVMDIIEATEEKIGIVDCINKTGQICSRSDFCTIKSPMHKIQKLIEGIFERTTINDLSLQHQQMLELKIPNKNIHN